MRILSKKLIIAVMAISMAIFPALNANAQAATAGAIAGVTPAVVAVVAAVVVVGAVASSDNDSGRPDIFLPVSTNTSQVVPSPNPPATSTGT